jgi:hypothetical protein
MYFLNQTYRPYIYVCILGSLISLLFAITGGLFISNGPGL